MIQKFEERRQENQQIFDNLIELLKISKKKVRIDLGISEGIKEAIKELVYLDQHGNN